MIGKHEDTVSIVLGLSLSLVLSLGFNRRVGLAWKGHGVCQHRGDRDGSCKHRSAGDLVDSMHMALEARGATRERGAAPCWPGTQRRCCHRACANPAAHAKGVGPGRPYPAMGLQPTHQGKGQGLPWAQAGLPWAQAGLPWVDPGVTLTGLP